MEESQVIRYGQYRRKVSRIVKKIDKIWKKGNLKCEMIWKIWKKDQFNSEMIWKTWKKSKWNSEKIWKIKKKLAKR